MSPLEQDVKLQRARLWQWLWASVTIVLLLVLAGAYIVSREFAKMERVTTWWDGNDLCASTISRTFVVTHLAGHADGLYVIAQLEPPVFNIDSEKVRIPRAVFEKLKWRTEGGETNDRPAIGSEIRALYYRPSYSEWRAPTKGAD